MEIEDEGDSGASGVRCSTEGADQLPATITDDAKNLMLEKAHSLIVLSLTDEVLREVGEETTAAGMWTMLEDKFQKKSLTNRLYQKQRLYTLQMSENISVRDHLDNFNQVIWDLQSIGVKIDDEDQAIILLCSLPKSYENFIDIMLYGRDSITVNNVKDSLQSKELKRRVSSSNGDDAGLIVSRGRSMERGNSSKGHTRSNSLSKSKKVRCYKCKEVGHIRKNFPQLKKEGNNNVRAIVARSSAVVSGESSDEGDGGDVLTVSTIGSTDTWVMDTGASNHMTFNKELFSSFKE